MTPGEKDFLTDTLEMLNCIDNCLCNLLGIIRRENTTYSAVALLIVLRSCLSDMMLNVRTFRDMGSIEDAKEATNERADK